MKHTKRGSILFSIFKTELSYFVWTGLSDSRAAELMRCPENVTIVADGEQMNVSWPDPIFYDAQGSDIKVTSTFGTNRTALSWGEHRVEYTATNTYNNRTTFCVFHIDVFRKSYRLHGKCMHASITV